MICLSWRHQSSTFAESSTIPKIWFVKWRVTSAHCVICLPWFANMWMEYTLDPSCLWCTWSVQMDLLLLVVEYFNFKSYIARLYCLQNIQTYAQHVSHIHAYSSLDIGADCVLLFHKNMRYSDYCTSVIPDRKWLNNIHVRIRQEFHNYHGLFPEVITETIVWTAS
jgi:hypothetical protein